MGIIFILLFSGCISAPEKIVVKEYVCFDGAVVDDAKDCRIQEQGDSGVYVTSPSNASANVTWACSKDMPYVASRTGKTYHLRDCSFAKRIAPDKAMCFKTREEAEAIGYALCKTCGKRA